MFQIGINENKILSKVSYNEQPNFSAVEFSFGVGEASLSPFEQAVDADGYASTGETNILRFFAPKPADAEKFDKSLRTTEERANDTMKTITEFKNLLHQFALCYTTSDKIKQVDYATMAGLSKENWVTGILDPAVVKRITLILLDAFTESVKEYLGKEEFAVRIICIRNSKGYPELRKYYIKDNPVVESMQCPLAGTRLKFTKQEITKGLNSNEPVAMTPDALPEDITPTSVFKQQ